MRPHPAHKRGEVAPLRRLLMHSGDWKRVVVSVSWSGLARPPTTFVADASKVLGHWAEPDDGTDRSRHGAFPVCRCRRYRETDVGPTRPLSGNHASVQPVIASAAELEVWTSASPGPLRCRMEMAVAARMIWQSIGPSTDSPRRRAPSFCRSASVRQSTAPGSSRGQASGWDLTSGRPGLGFLGMRAPASNETLLSLGGCASAGMAMASVPTQISIPRWASIPGRAPTTKILGAEIIVFSNRQF
jgi:hypothetical protein